MISESEAEESYGRTRYGRKIVMDTSRKENILDFLLHFDGKAVLYPTTDSQVEYFSAHRARLPSAIRLLFPSHGIVEMLTRKDLFFDFANSRGDEVPPSRYVQTRRECIDTAGELKFPVIAKTRKKVYKKGLKKAYILQTPSELISWYEMIESIHSDFIIQEYIPGDDSSVFFTMQYISEKGDLLASFTGRKIRQWPLLTGGTASAKPYYSPELTRRTHEFFRDAGLHGICSMEYKQDPQTGRFYLIEPTVCRTDFQEGVSIANGVNIPLVAFRDAVGNPVRCPPQKKDAVKRWMHLTADRLSRDALIEDGKITYFQWLKSMACVRSNDLFTLYDPGPLLHEILIKLRRLFCKRER
ncbi:MAG: hypothetical protein C4576_35305 [Desulfobacteraceae bacterium]|nr:MAG: hypothetical protein C4576_35305 [Desulfobacteraceae bacterium]